MSRNAEVADRFEELADRLEAREVAYKPRSYRTAAANIREHPEAVEALAAEGPEALQTIEGVGDAISEKIVEYIETGEMAALEAERERLPVDIRSLTAVEGLGPKRIAALYEALDIQDLDDLEAAGRAGQIREVSGFGERTEEKLLENLEFAREARSRTLLSVARPIAEATVEHLSPAVERVEPAGSLRRWKPTIGDVDVIAGARDPQIVVDRFAAWDRADAVIEAGENKASVRVSGERVDLRVVVPDEFGSALQYFTGSREHNIRLRQFAIDRGLKVNEYGVFDVSEVDDHRSGQRVGHRIAGETEADVYDALDLEWIPPELREDIGEIDAARNGALPTLLTAADLNGDLHVHTDGSDGRGTVDEMIAAATDRGDEYLAITDHATGPGMVGGVGLDDQALREHATRVRRVAADHPIEVLVGVETNIDADGDLSTADAALDELDIVIASPHSALGADAETATDRLSGAIEHPQTDILGHPTGRLLNQRPGLSLDVETIARTAAEHGVALEVNAQPSRLDLDGGGVRTAIESGATIAIGTDAHGQGELDHMRYGVHTARRGGAETADVINTRDLAGLRSFLEQ